MENGKAPAPHKFQKGVSGNPAGRPKGSKNRITIMKLALEGDLRTRLGKEAHEILDMAIKLAKAGDTAMIKLLVDKMIPTSRPSEDEPVKEKVQVFIGELPEGRDIRVDGRVVSDQEKVN